MQFFALAAAAFSAVAAAAPTNISTTYAVKNFYERKLDGVDISAFDFDILATNGGGLNFTCVAYDPALGYGTPNFEVDHVYNCGNNSLFSFNYQPESNETAGNWLYLWQDVTEAITLGGKVQIAEPVCHAGGSNATDLSCYLAETYNITLHKLG